MVLERLRLAGAVEGAVVLFAGGISAECSGATTASSRREIIKIKFRMLRLANAGTARLPRSGESVAPGGGGRVAGQGDSPGFIVFDYASRRRAGIETAVN